MAQSNKLNSEQKLEIIKRYQAGESSVELGKYFDVTSTSILDLLKKNNIERRKLCGSKRKYLLNEFVFDEITPESAYWIGFLFADGSVRRRENGAGDIAVNLAESDVEHLNKFRAFLQSNHKLYKFIQKTRSINNRMISPTPCVRLAIRSSRLATQLEKHGMNKKSSGRVAPDYLKYNRDFWRGVVDGDGWLGIYNNNPTIGLSGGQELLSQYAEFAKLVFPHSRTSVTKNPTCHRVAFYHVMGAQLVQILYKDAIIYLDRKYEIAKKIMSISDYQVNRTQGEFSYRAKLKEEDVIEILALKLKGWSYQILAERFGVSVNAIMSVVKGRTWKHISREGYE